VVAGTLANFESFSSLIEKGDYYNAGFALGKSLHYLQDSYSEAHTKRDSQGRIIGIYDYAQQSPPKHAHADKPARDSASYKNALEKTATMIRMHFSGAVSSMGVRQFYAFGKRVEYGVPGEHFDRPKNIISPTDLIK
jgi:hypothetical protein